MRDAMMEIKSDNALYEQRVWIDEAEIASVEIHSPPVDPPEYILEITLKGGQVFTLGYNDKNKRDNELAILGCHIHLPGYHK